MSFPVARATTTPTSSRVPATSCSRPDLRGFGERADFMPDDKYHCDWNLVCATMAGVVPLERNLWDLGRALDVLAAHPLVDPTRIAAAGLSYGGTCTLFLAALDDRVAAAVVSGFFSSWQAAHTVPWNMCGSQVLPGMLGSLEHVDLAALCAPRPLLVETGIDDPIFPVAAATASMAAAPAAVRAARRARVGPGPRRVRGRAPVARHPGRDVPGRGVDEIGHAPDVAVGALGGSWVMEHTQELTMYGYNPLAIDQLAQARLTQARRDGTGGREVRRLRRAARRQNRPAEH